MTIESVTQRTIFLSPAAGITPHFSVSRKHRINHHTSIGLHIYECTHYEGLAATGIQLMNQTTE